MKTQADSRDGKSGLFRSSLDERPQDEFFAREGVDPLTHAFDRKLAVHAGFGGRPVLKEHRLHVMDGLLLRPRCGPSAIYVHVPFCESRCLYCGFFNRAYTPEESGRYTDGLLREIEL